MYTVSSCLLTLLSGCANCTSSLAIPSIFLWQSCFLCFYCFYCFYCYIFYSFLYSTRSIKILLMSRWYEIDIDERYLVIIEKKKREKVDLFSLIYYRSIFFFTFSILASFSLETYAAKINKILLFSIIRAYVIWVDSLIEKLSIRKTLEYGKIRLCRELDNWCQVAQHVAGRFVWPIFLLIYKERNATWPNE